VRILLTGAGGQLGRSLVPALAGRELVALERRQLDICRLEDVRSALRAHRPELAINAAAYNAVDAAEADPDAAAAVNEVGPRNLALATAELGASLLHVSSDYVFDGSASVPYDEEAVPRPLSAYGRSKLAGEAAVRASNPRHFIVRTAWLYAARGKNFPLTMLELARKGPLRVVNDQTGSPTYAPHLAAAIERLLGESAPFGTYHLAGAGAATWYELTVALFERMHVSAAVTPVTTAEFPRPAPRPRYSVLTTAREPRILLPAWRQGLDAFVAAVTESAT
jgi:dTDP-4-dehydrorhamnose reductase